MNIDHRTINKLAVAARSSKASFKVSCSCLHVQRGQDHSILIGHVIQTNYAIYVAKLGCVMMNLIFRKEQAGRNKSLFISFICYNKHMIVLILTFRAVALPWLRGWRRSVDISREFLTDISCSSSTAVGIVPSTLKKPKSSV